MINYKSVYSIANTFIKDFVELGKKHKFLEVCCGLIYASKCIFIATKSFNVFNGKEKEIENSIEAAAIEDMDKKSSIINLLKPLMEKKNAETR